MKKIYLILSIFTIVFTACETDFDVNATWEEVTVVYGLLDAGVGKELQQIKISKAFLGNMDALQMAQYADSINFDTDDLDVKIVRIRNNGITDTVSLSAVPTYRDGDLFHDTIIIYEFVNNDFLKSNSEYQLLIENKVSGNIVSGYTELISSFYFDGLSDQYKFGFFKPNLTDPEDSLQYRFKVVKWDQVTHGEIYQFDMLFRYLENSDTISLLWKQPLVTQQPFEVRLEGDRFFSFLREEIDDDDTKRYFIDIQAVMTVGTADLETYINVNQPALGIVQERPSFTNINNGLGLFSSRYTYVRSDVLLTDETKDYLKDELGRNFK